MALVVTRVSLASFRSYARFEFEPDERLTVVQGPNAVGKTNIVEAIQLLTSGASFRHPQWADCVRWGDSEARLELFAEGDGRSVDTRLSISESGRRTYRVNGSVKRKVGDVSRVIPCVVFTPDDLRMVKDSADRRRAAIDGVGDQLSPTYESVRTDFERIVRQRNAALKDPATNRDTLDSWTARLVEVGAAFGTHRRRLFDRIGARMSEVYETLTAGERLDAEYEPSWARLGPGPSDDPRVTMEWAIDQRRLQEMERGVTLVGPHRDEVVFSINGKEARSFASQGQQRTIALAWKLAEVKVISEIGGQPPILLLDDVMSELDEERRRALASIVGETAQTVMTTTNLGYFDEDLIDRAKIVTLW